jgi:drug/metabolite transporter (DMT)-like permease
MQLRTRAELWLLCCTLIWGSTFVVVKGGLDDASPLLLNSVRFLLASALFVPFALPALRAMSRAAVLRGGILGALLFAGFATQTVGLRYTTASKSAFVTGMLVVLTPIFQLLFARRPLRPGNVLGVALVTLGLYLLTSPEGSGFNVGDSLTLACAVAFALYIVLLDLYTRAHDPRALTLLQFGFTAVLSTAAAPLVEDLRFEPTPALLSTVAFLAVMATVVAIYVQTRYQRDTTPTRAAVIFSLEPVFAALLAWAVRGEALGVLGIVGGAVIVAGVLVSELSDVLFRRAQTSPE